MIIHDYLSIFESLENGEISRGKSEKKSVTLVKTLCYNLELSDEHPKTWKGFTSRYNNVLTFDKWEPYWFIL